MKRMMVVLVIAIGLCSMFSTAPAYAAASWQVGTVIEAGPVNATSDVNYRMRFIVEVVVSGKATQFYLNAPTGKEKEMLAVALAAMSTTRQVRVMLDPTLPAPAVQTSSGMRMK